MNKKIVLLGMMGSGKTTLGKIISKKLKIKFFDTDSIIEKECGLKINKIFDIYGEKYFRKKEEKIILNILSFKHSFVMSLGGGAFLNNILQKKILKKTISIWLKPNFITLYHRCKKSNKRPLLQNNINLKQSLKKFIKERYHIYSKADLTITLNKSPNYISNNIIERIKKEVI